MSVSIQHLIKLYLPLYAIAADARSTYREKDCIDCKQEEDILMPTYHFW